MNEVFEAPVIRVENLNEIDTLIHSGCCVGMPQPTTTSTPSTGTDT